MDLDKVKDRAAKLKAHMESAHHIGSTAEAEAFAGALNRLLLEYELSEDEIAYAKREDDPIIELFFDPQKHGLEKRKRRVPWQELLAQVVSRANLCKYLINPGSNFIWFVGTRQHTEVAAYLFATLIRTADELCEAQYRRFYHQRRHTCKNCGDQKKMCVCGDFESDFASVHGYKESWLGAFVLQIDKRLYEERKVVASDSTALMRLDNALTRAADYVAEKHKRKAPATNGMTLGNTVGRYHGTAAANQAMLDAHAMRAGTSQKHLESGATPKS